MAENIPRIPRAQRTPTVDAAETLDRLRWIWQSAFGDDAPADPIGEIFRAMRDDETVNGDALFDALMAERDTIPKNAPYPIFMNQSRIAVAYCIEAMRADRAGQRDLAWTFVADARYWAIALPTSPAHGALCLEGEHEICGALQPDP
jgi:hypothetical protein